MKKLNTKKGFTLIETLVGVLIFVMIMLAISMFSRNTWIYNSFISAGLNNSSSITKVLKTMSSEIRTASTAETGAYVISNATATSFTFYSDIDSDGAKEKIRYFLSGNLMRKGVTEPTGSPFTYNPANEVITTLIPNVNNSTNFEYFDKNYDGTTPPLSFPVDISSIRLVKINITIDNDPNKAPTANVFSTQISIRNLKDNL